MATGVGNPAAAIADATRFGEVRARLFFLIGALIVYRIGSFIPVPGINPAEVARFFQENAGTILGMANMFSGGALERLSIFAMGVMPYISASIIVQMASQVYPPWEAMKKEGEAGRRKLTQITRYFTLVLAVFQSLGAAVALQNGGMVLTSGWSFLFIATVTMTTGTMFLLWLGEQVTERGIGNGISMIILASIVSGIPSALGRTVESVNTGEMSGVFALVLIVVVLGVTAFCVYCERAQRRIAVHYAKRQVGRRVMAGQTSHLPFKLNMAGVIPPIFASSLLLLPTTIVNFSAQGGDVGIGATIAAYLGHGRPLFMLLYAALIIFFAFFYTAIVFNPVETADNLKKQGGFIPGIRPGEKTAEFIDKVLSRITVIGAGYLVIICLLPEILVSQAALPFYFGGTSLLIVVSVTMDTVAQVHGHLLAHQYEGLVKKSKLRGRKRS